jgi:hypothetical protein
MDARSFSFSVRGNGRCGGVVDQDVTESRRGYLVRASSDSSAAANRALIPRAPEMRPQDAQYSSGTPWRPHFGRPLPAHPPAAYALFGLRRPGCGTGCGQRYRLRPAVPAAASGTGCGQRYRLRHRVRYRHRCTGSGTGTSAGCGTGRGELRRNAREGGIPSRKHGHRSARSVRPRGR